MWFYPTQDNNINGVKNLYNGNISETLWRSSKDNILRSYGYTYDALNRLRDAQYIRPVNPDFIQSPTNPNGNPDLSPIVGTFNESMQYDKNGNIVALQRNGGMESQSPALPIDNLVYQYDGNQLTKVDDSASISEGFKDGLNNPGLADYTYDLNGNMTTDQNKGIINAITYNHLNLPTKITLPEGVITYVYNALGQKVSKTVNTTNTNPQSTSVTEYLGGYQYNINVLQFFPTAEGYVKNTVVNGANSYDYIFNYTDHLGNIRLSYGIAPSTHLLTIFEENNYYPFGLKHGNYNNQLKGIVNLKDDPSLDTPIDEKVAKTLSLDIGEPVGNINFIANSGYQYKYNGKEYQDELGLNMYDYGSRLYDPARAGWSNIDPLAEVSRRWSPYTYCYNNPLIFVDPDGMIATPPTELFNTDGKKIGQDANGNDGKVSIIADKAKAKEIQKNYKAGGVATEADVASGVQTTKVALNESVDVLNRTEANGGGKEERSIVMADGTIHRAATGDDKLSQMNGKTVIKSAIMEIPEGEGKTGIHSHPTKITGDVNSGLSAFSATEPGPADPADFKENSLNIVVGNLGLPEIKVDELGNKSQVNPSQGAVFYNSNAQPLFQLSKSALEKIAK